MTIDLLARVAATPTHNGERRWFLSLPTWIRAGGDDTGGALSLVEQEMPAGFTSPWHVHHDEDEFFYVVAGAMAVNVDGRVVTLGTGGFAFGPRGVPHGFRIVGSGPARVLLMSNSGGLAAFIGEASAVGDTPPAPQESDIPTLIAVAQRHGIAILGPMPD